MAGRAQKADEPETPEGWFVTAPLVEVAIKSGGVRHLSYGSVLGDDVTKECHEHLKSLGFITKQNPATAEPSED